MDRGRIDVAQPDIGRVGGITEAMRVAQMAQDRGKLIVPHCWKTGIGAAATAHFAAATSNCRFIEFLPPFRGGVCVTAGLGPGRTANCRWQAGPASPARTGN
jgi:L-alanine-DL-glutamate epimerase-like enolase superfamily enzyme